ncbi:MAG: phosphatase PAP2 family protein [Candidatus Gracilibacteria bacterium]
MIDHIFGVIALWDMYWVEQAASLHTPFLDHIMISMTHLGDWGMVWMGMIVGLFFYQKFRIQSSILLAGLCVNILLGEVILKHIFHRARPFETIDSIHLLVSPPITSSFPSGHASASVAFALLFTWLFSRKYPIITGIVCILACLIAFSRFYLQVHYPSDILVGIILGCLSAGIVMIGSMKGPFRRI